MKKAILISVIVLLVLAFAAGGGAYLFFANHIRLGDEYISVDVTELNLNNRGFDDLTVLSSLKQLKSLDIRGNYISPTQYEALQESLHECEIIWSVPIGTKYFDSNITAFSMSAQYVEDLYNIRHFTELETADVSGTNADYKRLYELKSFLSNTDIWWTETINGEEVPTNTEELDLSEYYLEDPSILKCFSDLKVLRLSEHQLDDPSILAHMTKLEVLDIANNNVTDISWLENMTELRELDLTGGINIDLSAISKLSNLEVLNLDSCSINNYQVIGELTSLRELNLRMDLTNTADYSFLSNLTALETLTLDYSGILNEDIPLLSELINLRSLSLTGITFTDLTPFYSMTWLENLNLKNCGLSTKQLSELKKALPDCKVKG